jgi:GntR family transcriptional regulator
MPRPARRAANGVPLYRQIADSLLRQIESGHLGPGERLPPERMLSETLGVNRMTLRHALDRLEFEGYLSRRQGSGTFVAHPKIERQAGWLVPFSRSMARRGYRPGARVIVLERQPASVTIAAQLRVPVSSPIYAVRRVRLINREPVMLETFWMPEKRFPRFERFDITRRSVYEIMETEYGVKVRRARQSLEPAVASAHEARLLGIERGDPLMLEERLSFDERGRPIEYGKDLYRGDRFRFVTESAPVER